MATITKLINLDTLTNSLFSILVDSEFTKEYFLGMGGYVLLFILLFWWVVPHVSASLIPSFKNLDESKYFQTVSDLVSTITSSFTASVSVYNYFHFADNYSNPLLFDSLFILSQIMSAYFIMDTVYKFSKYPEVFYSDVHFHPFQWLKRCLKF